MTTFIQKLFNLFLFLTGQGNNNSITTKSSSKTRSQHRKPHNPNRTTHRGKQRVRHQRPTEYRSNSYARSSGTDLIGLVIFNDNGQVVAKPAEPHAHWLQERVASLPSRVSGFSTNITDGLRKGLGLLKRSPKGRLRRIWLLTDGMPNREQGELMSVVAEARRHHVNINTIGFGDPGAALYDPGLLKKIAGATHNGRFVQVNSLRALSNALKRDARSGLGHRRPETTVLVIDCSGSMVQRMENKPRIDVVVEAINHLLHYKQKCFS